MAVYVYISLQREDRISLYELDSNTGGLTRRTEFPLSGMPAPMAVDPQRRLYLFVGRRQSARRLRPDQLRHQPRHRAADRAWRCSAGGRPGAYLRRPHRQVPVVGPLLPGAGWGSWIRRRRRPQRRAHRMAGDGHRGALHPDRPVQPLRLRAAHRGGRPHGRQRHLPVPVRPANRQADCLRPRPGGAKCAGRPSPRLLPPQPGRAVFVQRAGLQRHGLCRFDRSNVERSVPFQTVPTLPEGYTERNSCSQIQITPSGKFLYAPNRGHNSIAGFAVDGADGTADAPSVRRQPRTCPAGVQPGPIGQLPVRRRAGIGAAGVLPGQRRKRGAGAVGGISHRPRADVGADGGCVAGTI